MRPNTLPNRGDVWPTSQMCRGRPISTGRLFRNTKQSPQIGVCEYSEDGGRIFAIVRSHSFTNGQKIAGLVQIWEVIGHNNVSNQSQMRQKPPRAGRAGTALIHRKWASNAKGQTDGHLPRQSRVSVPPHFWSLNHHQLRLVVSTRTVETVLCRSRTSGAHLIFFVRLEDGGFKPTGRK